MKAERFNQTLAQLQSIGRVSPAVDLREFQTLIGRVRARLDQLVNYVPGVYPVEITFFVTGGDAGVGAASGDDISHGWNSVLRQPVRVCGVAGEHHTMFTEPYVRDVAAKLNATLSSIAPPLRGNGRPHDALSGIRPQVSGVGLKREERRRHTSASAG